MDKKGFPVSRVCIEKFMGTADTYTTVWNGRTHQISRYQVGVSHHDFPCTS